MNAEQGTFLTLFGEGLDPQNRWMLLKDIVPWDELEQAMEELGPEPLSPAGRPGCSTRVALGSLIIKEVLGLTDRETVAQIQENPYLQAFLGYASYSSARPFDPSLMVSFRKRFDSELIDGINRLAVEQFQAKQRNRTTDQSDDDNEGGPTSTGPQETVVDGEDSAGPEFHARTETGGQEPAQPFGNEGTLMLDATCAPADMAHPNDIDLLNHARVITERVIDRCHGSASAQERKPRTYRQKARIQYLRAIKRKRHTRSQLRRAKRQQLQYIRRNLGHIDRLVATGIWSLDACAPVLRERLETVRVVFTQHSEMYAQRSSTVANRIYNIAQPHVRAMRRSKPGKKYEWGAKVSASYVDGFAFIERMQWNPYNETADLTTAADNYHLAHGHYPERILADRIYRTRSNRAWCNERGIRLAGIGPGRPPKDAERRAAITEEARQDEADRQPMEGVFGRGKRRFSLKRVMTKLSETSKTAIAIVFLVMNLLRIAGIYCAPISSALWIRMLVLYPHTFYMLAARLNDRLAAPTRQGWLASG